MSYKFNELKMKYEAVSKKYRDIGRFESLNKKLLLKLYKELVETYDVISFSLNNDEITLKKNEDKLKNYLVRIESKIKICDYHLNDKQNEEYIIQQQMNWGSIILGILSIIFAIYSIQYANEQTKNSLTQKHLKELKETFKLKHNQIEKLLIEKENNLKSDLKKNQKNDSIMQKDILILIKKTTTISNKISSNPN